MGLSANELRIGNWVNKAKPYQWKLDDFVAMDLYDDEFYIEPIPLTEEWLLKFGFEKTIHTHLDKTKTNPCYKNANLRYYLQWYSNKSFDEINTGTLMLIGIQQQETHLITSVNHVHQLQNLYFALTGQELTLLNQPVK